MRFSPTRAIVTLLVTTLLAGCGAPTTPPAPTPPAVATATAEPAPPVLGQPFSLRIGQTAAIDSLTVTLIDISADSRCPAQVACAWEGAATARLSVTVSGQDQGVHELILYGHDRATEESRVTAAGYTVRLVSLAPYPNEPQPIPAADYTAQLIVEPGAAVYTPVGSGAFDGVIVPEQDADALDPRADGYWTPGEEDVLALEAGLTEYLRAAAQQRSPDLWQEQVTYKRQYAGLIRDGHRLIYASFFCATVDSTWRQQVLFVMDGGDCYFQLTFDVERRTYGDLMVNGEA
jgi:hypothetical protein